MPAQAAFRPFSVEFGPVLYEFIGVLNLVRHEQAAVHAAEGYARVTGKCGVALVTSGPGATNIVTGLANAYLDGYPLVVITGQVMADLIGKDAFQEVDIIDITKTCTKKNFQVRDAKYLEAVLVEAFNTAMSGKQGPVVVDIAKNVFSQEVEFDSDIKYSADKNCPFDFEVENAIKAVCKAKAGSETFRAADIPAHTYDFDHSDRRDDFRSKQPPRRTVYTLVGISSVRRIDFRVGA